MLVLGLYSFILIVLVLGPLKINISAFQMKVSKLGESPGPLAGVMQSTQGSESLLLPLLQLLQTLLPSEALVLAFSLKAER
jgi:hypothetical protein